MEVREERRRARSALMFKRRYRLADVLIGGIACLPSIIPRYVPWRTAEGPLLYPCCAPAVPLARKAQVSKVQRREPLPNTSTMQMPSGFEKV